MGTYLSASFEHVTILLAQYTEIYILKVSAIFKVNFVSGVNYKWKGTDVPKGFLASSKTPVLFFCNQKDSACCITIASYCM